MRLLSNTIKGRGVVFLALLVCLFGSVSFGQPWDGNGVEEDPYQIWTAADMQAIGGNSAYWSAHFELMANIDLSAYTGTSFNIIGNFTGVFDGNGHTISNFTYSTTGTNYIGVFGYVPGAEIKDLGLINPIVDAGTGRYVGSLVAYHRTATITGCYVEGGSVSGTTDVGGLVGYNKYGLITNCYFTGSVSGTTNVGGLVGWSDEYTVVITNCYSTGSVSGVSEVGGLVGKNSHNSTVTNCYSQGSVSGDDNVGGLVGKNEGTVINCYSTGSVSGTGSYVGGLLGFGGPVCVSFWDTQTSGQSTSSGGKGKTTAQMQTASTFFGWGGCGSEGVWVLDEGNDYPRLWWENKPGQPLPTENLSDFVAGAGTEQDPYLIETGEQMNLVGVFWCEWDKHFLLMADIDLSAYTGTSFNIIGICGNRFWGTFDGNGHTISNFSYDSNNTDYIGIFSRSWGGTIRDLGLINPNVDAGTGSIIGSLVGYGNPGRCYVEGGSVSGKGVVGGLVGSNVGTMSNCYASASVSGIEDVGGLVGVNGAAMTNCSSTGSVSGTTNVGGLVGRNYGVGYNATISRCYSTGTVSGVTEVGGLVGRNDKQAGSMASAAVYNSYSTASVTGYWYVGGLVGSLWTGGISKCYSAGSVSGFADVGGLLGYKEGTVWITDSFWDTEASGQTTSAGGVGMPTELMQSAFIFTAAGWDFVGESVNGTDDFWDICDGTNYPKLAWQIPIAGDFNCPDGVDWNDLAVLVEQWLFQELSADVWPDGGDGFVNFFDWAIFADGWQTTIDFDDLAEFADQWLKTGSNCLIADIAPGSGGDGIVNFLDFAALANNWLAGM